MVVDKRTYTVSLIGLTTNSPKGSVLRSLFVHLPFPSRAAARRTVNNNGNAKNESNQARSACFHSLICLISSHQPKLRDRTTLTN